MSSLGWLHGTPTSTTDSQTATALFWEESLLEQIERLVVIDRPNARKALLSRIVFVDRRARGLGLFRVPCKPEALMARSGLLVGSSFQDLVRVVFCHQDTYRERS
jgi:hypothetical protein